MNPCGLHRFHSRLAVAGLGVNGVTIPMVIAGVGVIASIIGTFFVRSGEKAEQKVLLRALRTGVYISSALIFIVSFFLVRSIFPDKMGIFWAIVSGLVAGNLIGFVTEYFTSGHL